MEVKVVVENMSGSPSLLRWQLEVAEISEEVSPKTVVVLFEDRLVVDVDGA